MVTPARSPRVPGTGLTLRNVRVTRWVIVTVASGLMALGAPTLGSLSIPERIAATLFYGGLAVYGAIRLLLMFSPGYRAREWAPRWFEGPYRGRAVRGVAYPVNPAPGAIATVAMVVMGVGLLAGALYVGVTGKGVDGGQGTRIVGVILLVFFGLVLSLAGAAMGITASRVEVMAIVLAADAVHLPQPHRRSSIAWEQLVAVNHNLRNARILPLVTPFDPTAPFLSREALDLYGREERLARVDTTSLPDPEPLVAALTAAMRDSALRSRLARPDGVPVLQDAARRIDAPA